MNRFKIRTKLLFGFAVVLVLLILVGIVGLYCLSLANSYSDEMAKQKEIEVDAEIIDSLVYQARYAAMRGLYGKDVRGVKEKETDSDRTYRDYMVGRVESVYVRAGATLDRIIQRLGKENTEDITLCNEIKDLFKSYSDKTTQWADLQDKIFESADKRLQFANDMKASIDRMIVTTDANIDKEERTVNIEGKDEPYTHKRLANRQKQFGHVLEQIELCRHMTTEQTTLTDREKLEAQNVKILAKFTEIHGYISDFASSLRTGTNRDEAQAALKNFESWKKEIESGTQLIREQQVLFDSFTDDAYKIVEDMELILEHGHEHAKKAQDDLDTMVGYANMGIYLVMGLAVLVGIAAGLVLTYNITSGIGRAVFAMNRIAKEGDLSIAIPRDDMVRQDEVGELTRSFNDILHEFQNVEHLAKELAGGNWRTTVKIRGDKDAMNIHLASMLDQVNEALKEIDESVRQVSTGAGEVSSASQTLSSGAQESAASLEEITASMSEINSQTSANAQSAAEARDLVQQTTVAAGAGQEAMKEMNAAMERITKNSNEIQRVIKVIDDIAFQTNLLALNAAVEAARAGTHGKGFAVVAEEVRNLASRSAKAAHETSELISTSGREIQKGGEVAAGTGETLTEITERIRKTTDLVAGIAVASNEQAQGVAQISAGLQQIDAVTQQNTAAAEESASAANEMSGMASRLQELVAKFQLR